MNKLGSATYAAVDITDFCHSGDCLWFAAIFVMLKSSTYTRKLMKDIQIRPQALGSLFKLLLRMDHDQGNTSINWLRAFCNNQSSLQITPFSIYRIDVSIKCLYDRYFKCIFCQTCTCTGMYYRNQLTKALTNRECIAGFSLAQMYVHTIPV